MRWVLIFGLALAGCRTTSSAPDSARSAPASAGAPAAAPEVVAPSASVEPAATDDASPATTTDAATSGVLSVVALRALGPAAGGTYRVRGWVVKRYRCPECPPGAQCKPCMGDNIVLSDDPDRHETYDLDDRDVIVFTTDPMAHALGAEITVEVRVLDRQSSNRGIRDLEMVR